MVFEVVDRAEKNFDVKDELLGHTYGIQVLSVADLPQHIGDTGSAGFFERRQDANHGTVSEFRRGETNLCLRPDSVYLLLHTDLFLLESYS